MVTVKQLNTWTHNSFAVNTLKVKTKRFYHEIMPPKDTDGITNSEGPPQAL